MTNTKTIAIASMFAVAFASSAFASDSFLSPNAQNVSQPAQQQSFVQTGSNAYAQAPAQHNGAFTNAEQREFDRATEAALSR